jgi:hypothetical protein
MSKIVKTFNYTARDFNYKVNLGGYQASKTVSLRLLKIMQPDKIKNL